MDPQSEVRNRMRDRELKSGRPERPVRRDRASGGVKSEKNDEAAKQFEEERRLWKEKNAAKMSGGGGSSTSTSNGVNPSQVADDEDRLIREAHDLQEQNRESLANSIRMAREATEVGQETLMKLTAQKEQMKKMDEDLDKTNESLNRSERVIRGMKSTLGGLKNLFSKPKEHQSQKLGNVRAQVEADVAEEQRRNKQANKDKSALFNKTSPTNQLTPEEQAEAARHALPLKDRDLSNENEKVRSALTEIKSNQEVEDTQLDELGELLTTLGAQSKDMNTELRQQTVYTDHLDDQLVRTGIRVKSADNNVKQIH